MCTMDLNIAIYQGNVNAMREIILHVFCKGSSLTIKRGYWLGNVEQKLITKVCPINYCNFTCCVTENGYHLLLPCRKRKSVYTK